MCLLKKAIIKRKINGKFVCFGGDCSKFSSQQKIHARLFLMLVQSKKHMFCSGLVEAYA